MKWLKKAKVSLERNDPKGALQALSKHRKRFPKSLLRAEAELLQILAWCQSGDLTRGRAEAKAFAARYPGSALVRQAERACPRAETGPS